MNLLLNEDNKIIFEKIKELNNQFKKFNIPLLKYWIDVLSKGIEWNEQRKYLVESSRNESTTLTTNQQIQYDEKLFREYLKKIEDIFVEVEDIIDRRCSLLISD